MGRGTNLGTAYDQPALDGVYNPQRLHEPSGEWTYKLKLSEDEVKISNPAGTKSEFLCDDQYVMDVIYDLDIGISDIPEVVLLDKSLQHKNWMITMAPLICQTCDSRRCVSRNAESIHDIRKHAICSTFTVRGDKNILWR